MTYICAHNARTPHSLACQPTDPDHDMEVDEEAVIKAKELLEEKKLKFVIFMIEGLHDYIVTEHVGENGASHGDFVALLPPADCRYVLVQSDSGPCCWYWNPTEAGDKSKIHYEMVPLSAVSPLLELIGWSLTTPLPSTPAFL